MNRNNMRPNRQQRRRGLRKQRRRIPAEPVINMPPGLLLKELPKTLQQSSFDEPKEEYTAWDLYQQAPAAISYLLAPLIPSRSLCFLTGGSDCNKSTFLRQLAISIALGHPEFLGFNLNARHKKVLLVITEDEAENISVYLKKTLSKLGLSECFKNIHFFFTTEDVPGKIKKFISINPVDAVIIDTWTDTYSGDINTSNKVRENLNIYRKIIQAHPCAIICLHHTGKRAEEKTPSKNSMMGSQGIEATARIVLELRRLPENELKRGLTVLKGNYTPDSYKDKIFELELDPDTFTLKNLTDIAQIQSLNEKASSQNRGRYVKRDEVLKRLIEEKDGKNLSFERARLLLAKEFGEAEVPGNTQLKSWYREYKGGQSEKSKE